MYIYNNWYVLSVGWVGMEQNTANRQSTEKHEMYQLLYIYSIPPDEELQLCLKHVKGD